MKFSLIIFSLLTLASCAKKYGCTKSRALNYDVTAEKDDHSCYFLGQVGFNWYKQTEEDLLDDGHVYLNFYVDAHYIGSDSTNHQVDNSSSFEGVIFSDTLYYQGTAYFDQSKEYSLIVTNQVDEQIISMVIEVAIDNRLDKLRLVSIKYED